MEEGGNFSNRLVVEYKKEWTIRFDGLKGQSQRFDLGKTMLDDHPARLLGVTRDA